LIFLLVPCTLCADPAQFDLAGTELVVKVIHAGKTLPISEVSNLSAGDLLSIKADLPPGQSVHYLLIVAFVSSGAKIDHIAPRQRREVTALKSR
jgi:hypothetical protein